MQELRFRNLAKSKAYRDSLAGRGESVNLTRKRVIVAPSLTTACERDVTLSDSHLKSRRHLPAKSANQAIEAKFAQVTNTDSEDPKFTSYKNWIAERKLLRKDLNNCGMTHDWLDSKPSLSEIEQRVHAARPMAESLKALQKHRGSIVTGYDGSSDPKTRPSIKQPLPVILSTISHYLAKKRLRMYDLFVLADKDKDWKITKKEFHEAMKVAGIPIKDAEIEQLIAALDQNNNDVLEYKELAQGRDLLVQSERAKKQSDIDIPLSTQSSDHLQDTETKLTEKPSLASRSSSPSLLSLPDTSSSEVLLTKNLDKEKRLKKKRKEKHRNKATKESEKVRQPCTMGGETGLMVDKFQKQKQKEYEAILELCHLYGVQLSKDMLGRVLLHPEDRSTDVCISSLKPPSEYLLSEQELFRRLAPTTSEAHGKRRYSGEDRRTSSFYTYYVYPLAASVTPKIERMNLSSGSANVSRKTDCWMTYEEYVKLTRHLDSRFEKSWKPTDDDDYWPSYVLDKVRLYLDEPKTRVRSGNSIFDVVHNNTIH